ncbi:Uncharacterized membrane protein YhaH, DUF805 family [Jannaschia faecimaris]|uniref:Uncharacterized membrane protein YhaH, DUF805 family n=2 Tax=Jannaschia faecimaris TaxID=1244108 RepID=A0A1H3SJX9_9RHOB|nr:Uncharacterized membrane protein YhaH, DUF805 family [Jannaschia faecimaris]
MGPISATIHCMFNPFRFRGRATRSEFWWFTLFYVVLSFAASIWMMLPFLGMVAEIGVRGAGGDLSTMLETEFIAPRMDGFNAKLWWASLALLWPMFAHLSVMVRRLHDTDRSGWWFWVSVIPIVGYIILLILMVIDSDRGRNSFGPPPKGKAPQVVKRGLPEEPEDPLHAVSGSEALRALRQSRMQV